MSARVRSVAEGTTCRPTGAPPAVRSNGPMWSSAPTDRRGSFSNHPGQRRTAERLRRGWEERVKIGAEIIPKVFINAGQSLSQPAADSSLSTREPLRTEDADRRVASLLAMTVLILCHSEEAQRADVGIRLFYDGRGFGPPRSSAPTEGLPKPQQQAGVGIGPSLRVVYRSPSNRPMWASAPTESPINHPSQPARSEASAPAAARNGRESMQGPPQKGDRRRDCRGSA